MVERIPGSSIEEKYAHSLPGISDRQAWEPLWTPFAPVASVGNGEAACGGPECPACQRLEPRHGHVNKVAWWTRHFAREMAADPAERDRYGEWGYLLGLWHDLGKFSPEWQEYLARKAGADLEADEGAGRIDHSTAGGVHALQRDELLGWLLAFPVLGHHAGLPDAVAERSGAEGRLKRGRALPDEAVPKAVRERSLPSLPESVRLAIRKRDASSVAGFVRRLFSCLVDADFLATESFMQPERAALRPVPTAGVLERMETLLVARVRAFGGAEDRVSVARRAVYNACLHRAAGEPGFFSLTVPTGGGKTLSSLAFALRHAIRHGMRRVIYVIPFTSIIEQNAAVFRDLFAGLEAELGRPVVLEHHSNLSPERETTQSRLAAENWDAPLVVTTAVQFYESLHAARTSRCRKVHRMANAVVILDEAQCLPVDLLKPCLDALRRLVEGARSSVVLCTATQPAVERTPRFPIGLEGVREIVPDRAGLYESLKRVQVFVRGRLPDEALAAELRAEPQALAIVNTRHHARELYRLLGDDPAHFHLSALMCPAHRRQVLEAVRQRLKDGVPVRLVSTQLIEAGVDVDFPKVYRSLAGLDSVAQAAGRCNRNGRLPMGELHLFDSEHDGRETYFRETAEKTRELLRCYEPDALLGLEAVAHFFTLYYHQHRPPGVPQWDRHDIAGDYRLQQKSRLLPFLFRYRSTAERFRLIEEDTVTVLIPWEPAAEALLETLRNAAIPLHRDLLRGLQPYGVSLRRSEFERNRAAFETVREGMFHVVISPELNYSPDYGLRFDDTESTFLNY